MNHELKIHPPPFAAIRSGEKRFEFRKDDRTPRFEVGDSLRLREWWPRFTHDPAGYYSGAESTVLVTHLIRGPSEYGIPAGYVCMSIEVVK